MENKKLIQVLNEFSTTELQKLIRLYNNLLKSESLPLTIKNRENMINILTKRLLVHNNLLFAKTADYGIKLNEHLTKRGRKFKLDIIDAKNPQKFNRQEYQMKKTKAREMSKVKSGTKISNVLGNLFKSKKAKKELEKK